MTARVRLTRRSVPAPTIDEIALAESPESWARLGFALSGEVCCLGSVRLRFLASQADGGIVGWSLRDVESVELDGLRTSVSDRPPSPVAGAQPNGVLAIDHVVAMSPSFERSVGALRAAGLDLRRVREEPTPAGAPRQAFFRLGAEILELVEEPAEVVERMGGPDRPTRFWGLALSVGDLDRAVAALGEDVGEIRAAVQPGRRSATLRRSAGLSVALALMSADERAAAGASDAGARDAREER
jgi:hypothetical protein